MNAGSGNRTWVALVGGECSHHRTIPAPNKRGHWGAMNTASPQEKSMEHLRRNI